MIQPLQSNTDGQVIVRLEAGSTDSKGTGLDTGRTDIQDNGPAKPILLLCPVHNAEEH